MEGPYLGQKKAVVTRCTKTTKMLPQKPEDIRPLFKEVVVIGKQPLLLLPLLKNRTESLHLFFMDPEFLGNGPSAITLSYFLSGNAPYYNGEASDELLHLRLSQNLDETLFLQDLAMLSQVER